MKPNSKKIIAAKPSAKLARAKTIFRKIVSWESALFKSRDLILGGARELGRLLSELKEEVGHGNWLLWLSENFRELGRTDETIRKNAERCMKFFSLNQNGRNPANFDPESVRKFMWGYIPAKERLQLAGDGKDQPETHYLTFVNNFSKWDRQVQIGQAELPSIDVLRRELERPVRRIIALCGRDWVRSLL